MSAKNRRRKVIIWIAAGGFCLLFALTLLSMGSSDQQRSLIIGNGTRFFIRVGKNDINFTTGDGKKVTRYETGTGSRIFSSFISDLDGDRADEILLITGHENKEYGNELLVLKLEERDTSGAEEGVSVNAVCREDMSGINPWKVQTCDVDGDGKKEISVGVFKTTRFHPVPAKRPFLYNWHGGYISPMWLGSRLSRPFDDYIFHDINRDGKDELISIEHLEDGRKAINTYAWKGFGFESTGESEDYDNILGVKVNEAGAEAIEAIQAQVVMDGHENWISLRYESGKLVELGQ